MATAKEATPGNQDLATFQKVIQQQEGIFGPLLTLSSDHGMNFMEFRVGPSPDANHRAVLEIYGDHPPQRRDYSLVCIGQCLVGDAMAHVAAYRKTPTS